jgi:hypothetical protein
MYLSTVCILMVFATHGYEPALAYTTKDACEMAAKICNADKEHGNQLGDPHCYCATVKLKTP